jgi:hypothetical protein
MKQLELWLGELLVWKPATRPLRRQLAGRDVGGTIGLMQRNDLAVVRPLVVMDWSADFRPVLNAQVPAPDPRRHIGPTPAPAVDGAQEGFEVSIECRGLLEIDGVAGVGRYPEAGIGKRRLQH